ncbi:MAG: outer membrane protein assembly factor BamD [Ignavibacteria bacterium]|nr:outer membrane protein assembly factor BamD [Ignavibacteria bacterium]
MKKIYLAIPLLIFLAGCAGTVDVTKMDAAARYNYAYNYYKDESFDYAIKEFEAFLLQYPGNEYSDDAQFYLAQSHFQRKEYILAGYEFSKLIKNMPASSFVPESQYMLATCYYKLSPPYPLDQKYTKKAIEELQAFIDIFPSDARVAEAEAKIKEMQLKLAQKEMHSAQIYERMEYYTAAIAYYSKVIENFHDSPFVGEARYHKIKLLVQKNRIREALSEIDLYLAKAPKGEFAAELSKIKSDFENNPIPNK